MYIWIKAVCFIIVLSSCSQINEKIGQKDDWYGEELLEFAIQSQTGVSLFNPGFTGVGGLMVSLVSGSAELHPHLHLDPSLEMKGKSRFTCCFISCCFRKQEETKHMNVYCDRWGCIKEFDIDKSQDIEKSVYKTSARVAHLVSEKKNLEEVYLETGVDLIKKSADNEPITVKEIKKVLKNIE